VFHLRDPRYDIGVPFDSVLLTPAAFSLAVADVQ
jgi:hypothetical protein